MSAGDKEIILASEEVNRKNIQACVEFSNETRKLFRELEIKFKNLEAMVIAKDIEIKELRRQLAIVQGTLYAGGTVQE